MFLSGRLERIGKREKQAKSKPNNEECIAYMFVFFRHEGSLVLKVVKTDGVKMS